MLKTLLGMDVGATEVGWILANIEGNIIAEGESKSPFLKMGNRTSEGDEEVFLDTILTDSPPWSRVSEYLTQEKERFLETAGVTDFYAAGGSLCGKVWIVGNTHFLMGSNTPDRFAVDPVTGPRGISIRITEKMFKAANDGNAAATAQGMYYKIVMGVNPERTGYGILGTGYGFGVPGAYKLTEIGHGRVGFVHPLLALKCGCSDVPTTCPENYASGDGMKKTAEKVLGLDAGKLEMLSTYESFGGRTEGYDLREAVHSSKLREGEIDSERIIRLAQEGDRFAIWITDLAARVTADSLITAAQHFDLQIIGLGESVAVNNLWYVSKIAKLGNIPEGQNSLLPNGLKIEVTPLPNAAKYGALSLVVPEERYGPWVNQMMMDSGSKRPK